MHTTPMNSSLYKARCGRQGFSLIEVLVVVAIMGIIAATATPPYLQWLAKSRLKAAARELYTNMQKAKMRAISEDSNITLRFEQDAGGNGFYYFDDDGDSTLDPGEVSIEFRLLAGNVNYGTGSAVNDWNNPANVIAQALPITLTFTNRGTSTTTTSVFIANSTPNICYAVTSTQFGGLILRYFDGGTWN